MLEVTGVSKHFGGLDAVKDCSFDVVEGQVTGLVGPNGAGKTTLFDMITGTITTDSGRVSFEGRDITRLSPQERIGLGIARSFQDVRLIPRLSVIDNVVAGVQDQCGERLRNVLFAPLRVVRGERESVARALECLDYVGLSGSVHKQPTGGLSYGEQKLVSIARLIATRARLLLLDEPTSGLDEVSLDRFRGVLARLLDGGHTVLLVEHNMLIVRELCDRAVFLGSGQVLAVDTPEKLMENEDLRDVYFGA